MALDNLFAPVNLKWLHTLQQGLKAHSLFTIEKDYVIREGAIVIVDEFTGRMQEGRRWSDGLHQAIEAKEGLNIAEENQTLASITYQNYFRMYEKLSGMTGTAETEAAEFAKIYELGVIVIPTNLPIARKDMADAIYKTKDEKLQATLDLVRSSQENGQPVLLGTASIESNEEYSELLTKAGVKHNMLNAKQHASEASVIAQAGRKGMVTIATNMAGRGTDIVLGGNAEKLAEDWIADHSDENADEVNNVLNRNVKQNSKKY